MTEGYHYTACGLDYVYLRNGFEVRETPHGRGVSIKDARDLHAAIARSVVAAAERLRGQEVRFLRAQLKLSQEGLAKVLRRKRGAVARWEAEPDTPIPAAADAALRMFYTLKADGHVEAVRLVDLLTEIDELEHQLEMLEQQRHQDFQVTGHGWEPLPIPDAA